jgi:class 3 adenylate cyclase/tetratricopeptide (TPR) repeat protein
MTFDDILDQILDLLRRQGRVSYWALKRRFDLHDDDIAGLKDEIITAQRLAVDEDGKVLIWTGEAASAPATMPAPAQSRALLAYTPPHLTEKILTARAALEGERKQVTVLFADIKGSTELIASLDPEAARRLLDPALHLMMEAVHCYEGTVNQVLGDGIMALFGAPVAHEDHTARACYAALAMQAAMQRYAEEVRRTQGLAVQIRVGLNAGEVVVRAIGNDLHMDYSAVGPTTHLAARMEQLATPGSILLTATTLRLVEGLVRVNALGPVPVKGLTEPVEVFELIGVTAIRWRLQAAAAHGLSRFVGRDHELESLQQALHQAGARHAQIVAMVGEAGVGKSRLVYEFVHSHRTQGWLVLESASVSYGKATPYFPVLDLLKRYCHLEDGDDSRTIRAKMTGQVLTLDAALQEAIPALLSLLDVLPEDDPFLQLDPPQRRQRTLNALKRVLLRESQVQPLVLVFEDLHWIDSETQALLDNLVESLPSARVLLLVNYRPEYQHGWGSKTYYTQLRLDPLPPASANILLQALLGDDASLVPLTQLLITRTQGNPFFLEESVRALVETQVLVGERGAYRLAKALPGIQVPATVQAVLAARIDRLPPEEKQLLQTAAVIGTEVPLPLVQAIAELPEERLSRGLAHLQAAEFLYETHLFPERVYTFKHALTHEVAYSSLLQERRQTLHTQIVEIIERLYPDRLAEHSERLAHHALRGEAWEKVVTYLRQAGAKAFARSSNRDALAYFEQALTALPHLPETRETREQAIDVRFDMRNALFPLADFGRIEAYLREAEALARTLDDPQRLGWMSVYMSHNLWQTGHPTEALTFGQNAQAIAEMLGDIPLRIGANLYLGVACFGVGDFRRAEDLLRKVLPLLKDDLSRERFGLAGFPAALARFYLAWLLAERGQFDEGILHGREGTGIAEALDHPYSLGVVCWSLAHLYMSKGEVDQAGRLLERGLALSREWNLTFMSSLNTGSLGYAYTLSARVAEGIPLLEQVVKAMETMAFGSFQPLSLVWLGSAYDRAGRFEDALAVARRVLTFTRERGQRGYEARALYLLGEIASHPDHPDVATAEAHYGGAMALAGELGMRPLQAHCHLGLGTLYATTGEREQARTELAAAIDLYRAMDMTFWLPQTEAALVRAGCST